MGEEDTHHSSYPLATTSGRRNSSNDGGPLAVAPSWDRNRDRRRPGDRPGEPGETQYSSPLSSILEIHDGSRSHLVSPEASFQKNVSPVEFSTSSCQRCSPRNEGDDAAQADARAKASSSPLAALSSPVWKSTSATGAPDYSSLSHLVAMVGVLARSSGDEPAPPRRRAGVASMAWRTTRLFSTNAP